MLLSKESLIAEAAKLYNETHPTLDAKRCEVLVSEVLNTLEKATVNVLRHEVDRFITELFE